MTSEGLATTIESAVQALRDGRASDAVSLLAPVAKHDALSRAPDLQDVRARVCSLLAQSLLLAGAPRRAGQWAATSLRILRQHPDFEGQVEVRDLQQQIEAAIASSGIETAGSDGAEQARAALREARDAGSSRGTVLALLAIARTDPSAAATVIAQALEVADDANDSGLVAAVAQAANEHGVSLPRVSA